MSGPSRPWAPSSSSCAEARAPNMPSTLVGSPSSRAQRSPSALSAAGATISGTAFPRTPSRGSRAGRPSGRSSRSRSSSADHCRSHWPCGRTPRRARNGYPRSTRHQQPRRRIRAERAFCGWSAPGDRHKSRSAASALIRLPSVHVLGQFDQADLHIHRPRRYSTSSASGIDAGGLVTSSCTRRCPRGPGSRSRRSGAEQRCPGRQQQPPRGSGPTARIILPSIRNISARAK